ncbi:SDR family NAD(P)-dependent oxidoreductase [Saccharopolyspora sp. NPDC000359]|uniref:SDR family NAD(P)-dependent oxidoreductase n=1 Tax=Saccharopolyspora sp. NPDC000359 TaxID=3154251 RepID=UPI0033198597
MQHRPPIHCRLTLTSDNPIVDDHRVHGVRTLPGVTFLDVVHRVLDERGLALEHTELREVLFVEPVVVTEEFDREIDLELTWQSGYYQVVARSRKVRGGEPVDPGWTQHLQAQLHLDRPPVTAAPVEQLRQHATGRTDVERVYELGRAAEIQHRNFMKCGGTVHHHPDGLLADLELSTEAADALGDFLLHPALLDASTMQSYLLAFEGGTDARPLIPLHIAAFRASGRLGAASVVDLRPRSAVAPGSDVLVVDIDLHDPRGGLVARFEKLTLKRVRSRQLITRLTGTAEPAAALPAAPASAPVPEPAGPAGDRTEVIRRELVAAVRELLGGDDAPIDPDRGFYELGLESGHLLGLVRTLEQRWGIELYPTLLFEHSTIDAVVAYLAEHVGDVEPEATPTEPEVPAAPGQDAARTLTFSGTWERRVMPGAAPWTGRLLVVGADGGLRRELGDVVVARAGERFREVEAGVYELRTGSAADFRRLFAELADRDLLPSGIVHFGRPGSVAEAAAAGCEEFLALCQALLADSAAQQLPLLHVSGEVRGEAAALPAAMAGFAATIRLESPRLRCKVVEFAARPEAAAILDELGDDEQWVRRDGTHRHVRRYREQDLDADRAELPLRTGGVYLISGGSGALGRTFASWLVRTAQARVVLFGRSEPDLPELGGDVHFVQADVCEPEDLRRVVREARSRFGPVNGVIHAAGVLRDSLLVNKTTAELREVLAPKLRGVVELDLATRQEPLDFFAAFSSVTGVVGNPGQADYAAANGFLNGYLRSRGTGGGPGRSVSLCWPLWQDGGMRTDASTLAHFQQQSQLALPDAAGVEVFQAALRQDSTELVVFHGDPDRVRRSVGLAVTTGPAAEPTTSGDIAGPAAEPTTSGDIAIIGVAGRYPGAADLDQLWENLLAGRDSVTEVPAERWSLEGFYDPDRNALGRSYGKWGGFLDDVDRFDPEFFRITPREAESMDPQERLFLEAVWHTMEDAGRTRAELAGGRVGVFAGVMFNQYQMLGLDVPPEDTPMLPASFASSVANRVSYFFDFHGPSLGLDTMCSSSLTAVHLACQSLRAGDCEVAFAGGVNVVVHPYKYQYLSRAGFLSGDGRCRSFGAGGDGYVPGEGVGAVLLKPLERALADGDRVHAVIKGSAVNHGGRAGGYTVPNPTAQAELVGEALERSGVAADTIGYLEAHGTGTALGDPIEIAALSRVFASGTVPIGSIKSNLGHLEPAAGIAGLTKVLLQLRHRTLVPSLHAEPPNPEVDWQRVPFRVQRAAADWSCDPGSPRRAGVSAFGAGGANGHVILEEFVDQREATAPAGPQLVVLSARREDNLRQLAQRYADFLGADPAAAERELAELGADLFGLDPAALDPAASLDEWGLDAADVRRFEQRVVEHFGAPARLDAGSTLRDLAAQLAPVGTSSGASSLADIAYTTQVGRDAHEERLALVVSSTAELREQLRAFAIGASTVDGLHRGSVKRSAPAAPEALERALAERDLHALGELWVGGAEVDWSRLHTGHRPRRTSLPQYPFTRRRCWVRTVPAPEPEPAEPVADFLFTPHWEPALAAPAGAVPAGPVLIVHTPAGRPLAEALADRYSSGEVGLVELGSRTRQVADDRWEVDASDADALAAVRTPAPRAIYFLGGLLDPQHELDAVADLEWQEEFGVRALFHCVRHFALGEPREITWKIITADARPVTGGQLRNPGAAGLAGFAAVMDNEYPSWSVSVIDVDAAGSPRWTDLAERIVAEPAGTRVAYRDGVRLRQVLRPAELSGDAAVGIRPGGVYAIVGGAGGIGFEMARLLVQEHQARVALIGRSELDDARRQRIEAADPTGQHLAYVQADAADLVSLRAAREEIRARFGPVQGVLHSALVHRDRLLRNLGEADLRDSLAAKSRVTVALAEVFRDEPLDFLVLFSSVQSFLGDVGMANYAAGSAFQDAFAHALDAQVPFAVRTINWGYWGTVGAVATDRYRDQLTRAGFRSISPRTGWQALQQVLRGDQVQVVVMPAEPALLRRMGVAAPGADAAQAPAPAQPVDDDLRSRFRQDVLGLVAEVSGIAAPELDTERDLGDLGFDSAGYSLLATRLNETYGLGITPTVFYETASLDALLDKLAADHPAEVGGHYQATTPDPAPLPAPVEPARTEPRDEPVAIVGMAGMLPGSADLDEFWQHLVAGIDLVTEVPADRWDWREVCGADGRSTGIHARWGGFIADVDKFDPLFFGISPREAESTDPQQRLFLQTVWAGLEDAGIAPGSLAGSDTGLFVGVGSNDYQELQLRAGLEVDSYGATANAHSILANRISYLLDLHGPSEPVNTGCSSSLVALHRAAAAVRDGECEVAIAGGVNLVLAPHNQVLLSRNGMLSPDGRCRTFDAGANGYVRAEGTGAVVLTTRRRAEAAGHRVLAWVRGSAINHGGRARSLTAPNPASQARLVVRAHQQADVDPATIGYLETHGSGTQLGDPVEVSGLKSAFQELFRLRGGMAPPAAYCGLGAVKSNIGHLESGAGIAGVIKVLLAMRHGTLPPNLHYDRPNPYLQLEGSPFYVVDQVTPWQRMRDGQGREIPRRAGVSSFGYGGVNAHVVLEEDIAPEPMVEPGPAVFVLSAKTSTALREYAERMAEFLAVDQSWHDAAHTSQVGRDAMPHRLAVVAQSREELVGALRGFARTGEPHPGLHLGTAADSTGAPARDGDLDALARQWVGGAQVDWSRLHRGRERRLLAMPSYPFERRRCWIPVDRPAAPKPVGAPDDLLHAPEWVPAPEAAPASPPDGPVWMVHTADGAALADELVARLAPRQVHRVDPAAELAGLPDPAAVYFLAGVRNPARPEEPGHDRVEELFGLVKHLLNRPAAARRQTLAVVTTDACAVGPVRNPAAAALRGFAKSLGNEYRPWNVLALDFAWDDVQHAAAEVADHVLSVPRGAEVAVRGGRRLHRVLRPLSGLPEQSPFRDGGVYVLIGGAGEIGLDLAAHLVRRHRASVVLVGRSELDDTKRARLADIDPGAAHVGYVRADATDPAQLRRAVTAVSEQHGTVHGVVLAANVLRDGALHNIDAARFREGLVSKTGTTTAVAEVVRGMPLDFLLVISSVQSYLGNPGQSGYSAGCQFQDAVAHQLAAALPFPVRVVNPGAWGERGMAEQYRDRLAAAGVTSIQPEQGVAALAAALSQQEVVQVAIASGTPEFRARIGMVGAEPTTGPPEPRPVPVGESGGDWPERLGRDVLDLVRQEARVRPEELDADGELNRFGFDSITYTQLTHRFNETFDLDLTPAFCYGAATAAELADKLARTHPERLRAHYRQPGAAEPVPAGAGERLVLDVSQPAPEPARVVPPEPVADAVAVVGMAGMLPQSDDLAEFWAHLEQGDDLITEIPADRWDWRRIHGDPAPGEFRTPVKWGGFLRRVDQFDPLFFGISPTEAEAMDPQHRLALQAVWTAVEDAGIRPGSLAGTDTGVFLGSSTYDYFEVQHAFGVALDGYNTVGRSQAILANRVSYLLDLRGPSEALDTACSSSLVAVHRAVEAIRHGDCEMALAGGVNVIASPTLYVDMAQADMLSPDGRCKAFDSRANGYVRAEGVGVVLLKRLSAALADGDVIHGVLRGSAVNHGGRTNSLTAPNPDAQAACVVKAHERAGTDPRTVTYVETHGTGTALGDPVEVDGLKSAFATLYQQWGEADPTAGHCALGAVKSNTGHLEAAAGIAGLLKVLLAMRHGTLPKNLHIEQVNPYVRLAGSPFQVLRERTPWERLRDEHGRELPRRAGVSSFGMGGVNAHVVVEEHLAASPVEAAGPGLFVLSAKDEERLRAYATRFAAWLDGAGREVGLAALTRTLQTGRDALDERLAIVADDLDDLREKLSGWLGGATSGQVHRGNGGGGADSLLDGPEGEAFLRAIVANGKLDKLARLWTAGTAVDWALLWGERAPRRVPVPTYPFAAESYWITPGRQFVEPQVVDAAPAAEPDPVVPELAADGGGGEPPVPSAPADPDEVAPWLERRIAELLAGHLGVDRDRLRLDRNLTEYGVDSLGLRRLGRALSAQFGVAIPARSLAAGHSIRELTRRLLAEFGPDITAALSAPDRPAPAEPTTPGPVSDVQSLLRGLRSGGIDVEEAVRQLRNGAHR